MGIAKVDNETRVLIYLPIVIPISIESLIT
jgi:hypothetical protein